MLDDYKEEQELVYNVLINSMNNNKVSHAYLFETSGSLNDYNIVIAFAKSLICPYHYTNNQFFNHFYLVFLPFFGINFDFYHQLSQLMPLLVLF